MIRVLQVTDVLMQRSGITNVLLNYYRFIDKKRVQFDFFVNFAEEEIIEEIKSLGGEVYYFPKLSLTNLAEVSEAISGFILNNREKYVAIHSHFYQMNFLIFKYAQKYGISHRIVHSHATAFALNDMVKSIRNRLMATMGMPFATDYFACGEEAGLVMFGKKKVGSAQYYMLRNAIDASRFRYDPEMRKNIRKKNDWENDYLIGVAARLSVRKNQLYLIQLLPQLIKKQSNVKLIIMGDGEELERLKVEAQKLLVEDRVVFLGTITNVSEYLQAIDCFALPSYFEGLPLSVVEAQTSGLRCVVSQHVTKEVDIDNLCKHIDLTNKDGWIEALLEDCNFVRKDMFDRIEKWGYSLEIEADRLATKYETMT